MSPAQNRIGFSAIRQAAKFGSHWRLLLLWSAGLLLPTTLVAFPLWRALSGMVDRTVHAGAWAQQFDLVFMGDLLANLRRNGFALEHAAVLSGIVTLLLSPFLTGMVLGSARAQRALGFAELLQAGQIDYGRLFRMLFWAILPLGAAIGLGAWGMSLADKHGDLAILQSDAQLRERLTLGVAALLFAFAHATVEAGRVQFAVDSRLTSVIKAWWRGAKLVVRRPLVTLGLYLVITLVGFALAGLLGVVRIKMPHVSGLGFLGGFLVTQLIVMTTAWTRTARLLALAEVARPR